MDFVVILFLSIYILNQISFNCTFRSASNRAKTSAEELAERYNLGVPEFGNFYQAKYDAYVDTLQAQLNG